MQTTPDVSTIRSRFQWFQPKPFITTTQPCSPAITIKTYCNAIMADGSENTIVMYRTVLHHSENNITVLNFLILF